MRIDIWLGDKRPGYHLVLPVNCDIKSLAPEIQQAIATLGALRKLGQRELGSTPLDVETLEQIKKQGAFVWKVAVTFQELVGGK